MHLPFVSVTEEHQFFLFLHFFFSFFALPAVYVAPEYGAEVTTAASVTKLPVGNAGANADCVNEGVESAVVMDDCSVAASAASTTTVNWSSTLPANTLKVICAIGMPVATLNWSMSFFFISSSKVSTEPETVILTDTC